MKLNIFGLGASEKVIYFYDAPITTVDSMKPERTSDVMIYPVRGRKSRPFIRFYSSSDIWNKIKELIVGVPSRHFVLISRNEFEIAAMLFHRVYEIMRTLEKLGFRVTVPSSLVDKLNVMVGVREKPIKPWF